MRQAKLEALETDMAHMAMAMWFSCHMADPESLALDGLEVATSHNVGTMGLQMASYIGSP